MRLPIRLGAVALCLAAFVAARAEPPHLELVRGLRERGMPDLAMEYLQKLAAKPPADIAKELPFEFARTRLELAAQEPEVSKRASLIKQARAEFEGFLKNNPNHPLAPSAQVELARLTALEGKAELVKARRLPEGDPNQEREAARARELFKQAAGRFNNAAKLLDDQIAKLEGGESAQEKALLRDLKRNRTRAELEQGINLYNLGISYVKQDQLVQRGEQIELARKFFEKLAFGNEKSELSWVARAWAAQCNYEVDRKPEAEKEFNTLLKEKSPAAAAGVRVARAFRVRHLFNADKEKNNFAATRAAGDSWLRDYRAFLDTAEGQDVRFVLAVALQEEAQKGITRDKKDRRAVAISPGAAALLKQAEPLYKGLAETENEFTDRAARNRIFILLDLSNAEGKGAEPPPASLRAFEPCYLQAQVQQARLLDFIKKQQEALADFVKNQGAADSPEKQDAVKKKREEVEAAVRKEEGERYAKVVRYLERGLEVATPKDSPKELFDAQVLLGWAYLRLDNLPAGAVVNEHLARAYPQAGKSPDLALLAVQAYNGAMRKQAEGGGAAEADLAADRTRLMALARFMDVTWPSDAATDGARHLLAFLNARERNYVEACNLFAKISPGYPQIYNARLEEGGTLFLLLRSDAPADVKDACRKRVLADLESMPEPPAAAPADEALAYCQARVQLGQIYQLEGKDFAKVEQVAHSVLELLPKFASLQGNQAPAKRRDEVMYAARTLQLAGLHGQAVAQLKGKERNYAKVGEMLDPAVADIQKELEKPAPADAPPSYQRLRNMQREVLVLALRSSVQDGKIDRARDLLASLQKSGGGTAGTMQVLQQLVGTIRAQIDGLRREGNEAESKKLAEGFGQFLDKIAEQKEMPPNMLLFLARGYSSVDQHDKAAKLLALIPKPKDGKEDALRAYHQAQYLLARSYRLAKEYDKADKLIKEMIGDAKSKGWAYGSLEVRKEAVLLLEDKKKFRDAVNEWARLAKLYGEPLPALDPATGRAKNQKDAQKRERYFELYFETQRCRAKAYDALDPAKYAQQKDEGLTKVAQALVNLEQKNPDLTDDLKDHIRDTLNEYKALKDKYKAAGGKLLDQATGG